MTAGGGSGVVADRRGILTMVMVERDGRWQIRASHNARIAA
jgi:hypothetical protein